MVPPRERPKSSTYYTVWEDDHFKNKPMRFLVAAVEALLKYTCIAIFTWAINEVEGPVYETNNVAHLKACSPESAGVVTKPKSRKYT